MTVLEEMTAVLLTVPGPRASDVEIAAWYERKAAMLRHVATDGGPDADRVAEWAEQAAAHAAALMAGLPAPGRGAAIAPRLLMPVGPQPNPSTDGRLERTTQGKGTTR